jgi:2,4-dienoyl-CoA reductase-like NADH-dependent reductase (Old Yellow Enzyme family)/pyruvate/2-oxoglutarate dehydrogenase complex dihydrolipoamide dehydrogenase (E3) component
MSKKKYEHLLQPGYIGKTRIKNRMVRMAAHPGFPDYEDGFLQPFYSDLWISFAKGGAGLIGCGVSPAPGVGWSLDTEEQIPRVLEMNKKIHEYGAASYVQLFHVGPWMPAPLTCAASSLSIDEIPLTVQNFPDARPLAVAEIHDLVKNFGAVAERARRAGFDMCEINAGCNHLFATFLSRVWNKREDEYGFATMENRARFVVEMIKEIKAKAGDDFGVIVVANAAEPGIEKGITPEEGQEFARIFEAAGADALQARVEMYIKRKTPQTSESTHFPDMAFYPEPPEFAKTCGADVTKHGAGGWIPYAAGIKKTVKIPVIGTGRLDADLGEKLVGEGVIDFVNLNRRMIADHDYANKIAEGKVEDIAPCTGCMTCFNNVEAGKKIVCRINASTGREREYELKPATKKKNVVVVGSGPAGMETARVAALRGHKVTLLEKEPILGGSMNLAAVVKGTEREDMILIVDYLKRQMKKAGVDVKKGKAATKEAVAALKPDAVVIAVGGRHNIPDIPGINSRKVLTGEALHRKLKFYLRSTGARLMTKLVKLHLPVGKKVVIIGGTIQGCETAEMLVLAGRDVTIVETGPEIGEGMLWRLVKPQLLHWLEDKGVPMLAGVKLEEVTGKGLTITTKDGEKKLLEADTIITALPLAKNTTLCDELKGVAPEVHAIGDCNEPGLVVDAVAAGAAIARAI